jgi:hypothetical protein
MYVLTTCRMDALALSGVIALLARSPAFGFATSRRISGLTAILGIGLATLLWADFRSVREVRSSNPLTSSLGYTAWYTRTRSHTGSISCDEPAAWAARSITRRMTGIEIGGHPYWRVPFRASPRLQPPASRGGFKSPILALKDRLIR